MNSQVDLHHAASDCPNCGATVSGNFCHQCGQETVLHPPSTREFLHEFIGHYVALEGKLLQTMKLLLLKPGQLTLEYLRGRRVRYIEPLRVYLTFSLIFFAVFKFMGEDHHVGDVKLKGVPVIKVDPQDKKHAAPAPAAAPAPEAAASAKPDADEGDDKAADKASAADRAQQDEDKDDSALGSLIETFVNAATDENGAKFKKSFFSYAPYAVFAMMPLFALFLKILYLGSGKRYGEHLLFALHTNAFAFLMLTLLILLPSGIPLVGKLLGLWLIFYLPTAMRRVYGGSRKLTALRWCVLMFLHLTALTVAIGATVGVGASH